MSKKYPSKSVDMGVKLEKNIGGWVAFFIFGPHTPVTFLEKYPPGWFLSYHNRYRHGHRCPPNSTATQLSKLTIRSLSQRWSLASPRPGRYRSRCTRCSTHILQLLHNSLGSSRFLVFEFEIGIEKSRLDWVWIYIPIDYCSIRE